MRKVQDLEERLIDFAVRILNLAEALPKSAAGIHIGKQILRSGTSPAPNYGEAQSAESRKDFVHKMKVSLKELRETLIWLKIIQRKGMMKEEQLAEILKETDESVSISVSSVKTAEKRVD